MTVRARRRAPQGDLNGILNTLADYCTTLDQRKFGEFESLFTADALLSARLANSTFRGRKAIRAFVEAQATDAMSLHATFNTRIEAADEEVATAVSNFMVLNASEPPARIIAFGRFHDRLVFENNRWLFRERRLETEWRAK